MKKLKRIWLFLNVLPFILIFMLLSLLLIDSVQSSSSGTPSSGSQTTLTAEEVAEKSGLSVERAEDVIKILNYQLSVEQFTLEGSCGSLAVAERESGFDPEAVNDSGGVAGYFQWSGWSNQINGNRWGQARERKLDPDIELELMSKELNGLYKNVKDYMMTADNPKEAAEYWSLYYEGVALSDGQTKLSQLEENAQKWYDIFKDTIVHSDEGVQGGELASSWDFPSEYSDKLSYGQPTSTSLTTQAGSGYPAGQCTWYVYNRLMEVGIISASDGYGYLGNGQDWVSSLVSKGWTQVSQAQEGAVLSIREGEYGHVAFVEHVNEDGSFLISECNYNGNQTQIHWRVLTHANNYTYAIRK